MPRTGGHVAYVPEHALGQLRALQERQAAETRKLVFSAARQGATSRQIADALGVSRATLWRRHRDQLRRAAPQGDPPQNTGSSR